MEYRIHKYLSPRNFLMGWLFFIYFTFFNGILLGIFMLLFWWAMSILGSFIGVEKKPEPQKE